MSEKDEKDQPEVEGHKFVGGPEAGHSQAMESDEEGPDVEGHFKGRDRPQARIQKKAP